MKLCMFAVFLMADILSLFSADNNHHDCGSRFLVGPPVVSRIVGGQVALAGSWPWQVSIQFFGSQICGGTIINPLWVLTASHCFFKHPKDSNYRVVAGLTKLSQPGTQAQVRYITKLMTHRSNDIALLRLNSRWVFNEFVQPICSPHRSEEARLNFSHCFISGWGSAFYNGPVQDRLQEAQVKLIDRSRCNQIFSYNGKVSENMICAGLELGGVDSCQGDSGGPLQCYSEEQKKFYQLGITSFGEGCGDPFKPGVYTRTSSYSHWIEETLKAAASTKSSSNQVSIILSVGLMLLQFVL